MTWNRKTKQDLAGGGEGVYSAALTYLSRRDHAEQELRTKLSQRGAEDEYINETIASLMEKGYLDEYRFAKGRARYRKEISHRGRYFVRMELRELGLDDNTIEDALAEEYTEDEELFLLTNLVRKEKRTVAVEWDMDKRQRFFRSAQRRLITRGFNPGAVFRLFQDSADEDS